MVNELKSNEQLILNKEYRLGIPSFEKFAQLQNDIQNMDNLNIVIDCRNTKYISPAFATLFGSLPHYGEFYGKEVSIKYNRYTGKRYILDIGLDKYYNNSGTPHSASVPFSSLNGENYEAKAMASINEILRQIPMELDKDTEGELISVLGEIFNNAKDHSGLKESPRIKLYYCGHWNAKHDSYIVSIYDTGVGISRNVKEYLRKPISDAEALEWAFTDGNSTENKKDMDFARGIGLNSLEKFFSDNNGVLYVGSGNAICEIKKRKKSVHSIKFPLHGTIYVFRINILQR